MEQLEREPHITALKSKRLCRVVTQTKQEQPLHLRAYKSAEDAKIVARYAYHAFNYQQYDLEVGKPAKTAQGYAPILHARNPFISSVLLGVDARLISVWVAPHGYVAGLGFFNGQGLVIVNQWRETVFKGPVPSGFEAIAHLSPDAAEQRVKELFAELSCPQRRVFHLIKAELRELTGNQANEQLRIVGNEEKLLQQARERAEQLSGKRTH
jgi:hypothetical protein